MSAKNGKFVSCANCPTRFYASQSRLTPKRRRPQRFCSTHCKYLASKGQHYSTATEIQPGQRFNPQTEFTSERLKGADNYNWRGGVTPIHKKLYGRGDYRHWREQVFRKDHYRCMDCGQLGGDLQADHIFMVALFPRLQLDLNNGQTLCISCHKAKTKRDLQLLKVHRYEQLLRKARRKGLRKSELNHMPRKPRCYKCGMELPVGQSFKHWYSCT